MESFLLFVHVTLSIVLICLILLQHGKGADAGAAFGSGASATVFGSSGSSSFLTKLTTWLAIAFFTTSLSLAYISAHIKTDNSVFDQISEPAETSEAADLPAPAVEVISDQGGEQEGQTESMPDVPQPATESAKPEVLDKTP